MSARKRPIFKSQPVAKTSLPSSTTLSRQKALFIPSGQLHSIVRTDRHKASTLLPRALQRLETMSRSPNFHLFPWTMYPPPLVFDSMDVENHQTSAARRDGYAVGRSPVLLETARLWLLSRKDRSEVCLRKVFTAIEGRYKELSFAM
jgi:hypothetical protein